MEPCDWGECLDEGTMFRLIYKKANAAKLAPLTAFGAPTDKNKTVNAI